MTRCGIIELAPDHHEESRRWASYMEQNRAEVDAVFIAAGIALESFFLARIGDKDYLVSYIRIVDPDKARAAHLSAQTSTNPTTQANERFKNAVWRSIHEATLLFDHESTRA